MINTRESLLISSAVSVITLQCTDMKHELVSLEARLSSYISGSL